MKLNAGCQSDMLGNVANEIIDSIESAYDQVEAIRNWIHTHVEYRYKTSNASTSALGTVKTRVGVYCECMSFSL